jgi:hypothetical protein
MPKSRAKTASIRPSGLAHQGGCHCGAVRFEVTLEPGFKGSRCNCSICAKTAITGTIVKPDAFRLLSGGVELSSYVWGGRVSTRYFCKHCGIHCYGAGYLEQIGGDFVSVNLNCLDDMDTSALDVVYWDGRHDNWMAGSRNAPWPVIAQAS